MKYSVIIVVIRIRCSVIVGGLLWGSSRLWISVRCWCVLGWWW